ncbi:MAG TPA: Do family serine endopeptidase [Vicinamibacterales bacterium]|nr:Do family serine endopeptidase [Vicinamibacterales bacterium]
MHRDFLKIGRASASSGTRRIAVIIAATALLMSGTVIGWSIGSGAAGAAPAPGVGAGAPAASAVSRIGGGGVDSYADVVEEVAPAVVTIRAERRLTRTSQGMPDDPWFREFFGPRFQVPDPGPRRERGLGSGVIVRPDGYILTNHHVIDGATAVKVELTDGRTFDARVVGSDAPSDLAVLRIDGDNLATLALADSDAVRVGDVVLAVGNPLGVGQTVTLGIVSAKGRATGLGDGSYEDFIQTDAPINRGNSGGALVSTRGELIGINSQILSPSGGNIGIGFAIPSNMARHVMTQLIERGEVRRGLLGVTVQPVTSDIARSLGLDSVHGALVNTVQPGGPADKAGVRSGDVITAINGTPVKDGNMLRNEVAQLAPGTEATIAVFRDGRTRTLTATLAELERRSLN